MPLFRLKANLTQTWINMSAENTTEPKSIQQFVAEHPEHTELFREFIKVYDHWKNYNRFHYCEICDKKLTTEEALSVDHVRSFTITCNEHREYATVFQVELVRKQLNIPDKKHYLEF